MKFPSHDHVKFQPHRPPNRRPNNRPPNRRRKKDPRRKDKEDDNQCTFEDAANFTHLISRSIGLRTNGQAALNPDFAHLSPDSSGFSGSRDPEQIPINPRNNQKKKQQEKNKSRRDRKTKGGRIYLALNRFVDRVWGPLGEGFDFLENVSSSLVFKDHHGLDIDYLVHTKRYGFDATLDAFLSGNYEFNLEEFLVNQVTDELADFLIGNMNQLEAAIAKKLGVAIDYGTPSTWINRLNKLTPWIVTGKLKIPLD